MEENETTLTLKRQLDELLIPSAIENSVFIFSRP